MSLGEFQVVTSTLTLIEVLVHPLRPSNVELAEHYRDILFDQECLVSIQAIASETYLQADLKLV